MAGARVDLGALAQEEALGLGGQRGLLARGLGSRTSLQCGQRRPVEVAPAATVSWELVPGRG